MKLELHIVQNFAPSNLNRDDTGSPKDCEFGGVRRARISSQCFKRAIRDTFVQHDLIPESDRAARTKRLIEQLTSRVVQAKKVSVEHARLAVTKALGFVALVPDKKDPDKTEYLLFLPLKSLDALAAVVAEHLEKLAVVEAEEPVTAAVMAPEDAARKKTKAKSRKAEKSDAQQAADPDIKKALEEILRDGSRTPELALFGRMIADKAGWNVEAACQVAHAVSTNRVSMEFDFYTAIDDLKKDDTAGSDMMGTIPFNSACFYRYLVVDVEALIKNLGNDDDARAQAKRTVEAFIRAAVLAIPTGKQNSMAAQNRPSLVLGDVRDRAESRSLTNAFVEPVRPGREGDLVSQSAIRLAAYAASLDKVYGVTGRKDLSFILLGTEETLAKAIKAKLPGANDRGSLDALIRALTTAAFGAGT
jgi:CRISPR system Cascade subunit CasC